MSESLQFKFIKPDILLEDFVYCFSSLQNVNKVTDAIIIPNGKIDLMFSKTKQNQLSISLLGLETKPKRASLDISSFYSVSFNPLGLEYILGVSIADIVNSGQILPDKFWGFSSDDFKNFEEFCYKVSHKIHSLLPKEVDDRKRKLFKLILQSNGELSVKELSKEIVWSERQINRYFNQQFGISLKVYNNILRFQASLSHIHKGNLFPQLNFTDQSHFIKEIKKFSGVSPKELFKNPNDRFLQFLVYNK